MSHRSTPHRRGGAWPLIGVGLTVLALVIASSLMAASGPAFRTDWITLTEAFTWLRMGAQTAAVAAVLGIVTLIAAGLCRRWKPALAGALAAVLALMMIATPIQMKQRAQAVPPIHDITTDTDNPPAFTALADERKAAPNAVAYPGAETARQQRAAYPLLQPITIKAPLEQVMAAAQNLAQQRGWHIAKIGTNNTLEATATTRWFGFKDDVVIRLTHTEAGVQVDMRSASRLGKSDLGTNAERIQAFLADLKSTAG